MNKTKYIVLTIALCFFLALVAYPLAFTSAHNGAASSNTGSIANQTPSQQTNVPIDNTGGDDHALIDGYYPTRTPTPTKTTTTKKTTTKKDDNGPTTGGTTGTTGTTVGNTGTTGTTVGTTGTTGGTTGGGTNGGGTNGGGTNGGGDVYVPPPGYSCNPSGCTWTCYQTSGGEYSSSSACQNSCVRPPCMIDYFEFLQRRAWVDYPITGKWSASYWCDDCNVTCTPYPECVWKKNNISIGWGEYKFTIKQSGTYTYTLTCSGCADQRQKTITIEALNLPWWREIIPVLQGSLFRY